MFQVSRVEVGVFQVSAGEEGAFQVSETEVGVFEAGEVEEGALQVSRVEVDASNASNVAKRHGQPRRFGVRGVLLRVSIDVRAKCLRTSIDAFQASHVAAVKVQVPGAAVLLDELKQAREVNLLALVAPGALVVAADGGKFLGHRLCDSVCSRNRCIQSAIFCS